jgi:hypothetical protein
MDSTAAKAKAASAPPSSAASVGFGWTPDKITAEVQSALQEVLGRSLEPDEPFMSGGCSAATTKLQFFYSHT